MPTKAPLDFDRRPARAALRRVLPFAVFMVLLALRGALELPAWTYVAQVGLPAALILGARRAYPELRGPPAPAIRQFGTAAAGLAVFALWILPMPHWAHLGQPSARFVPLDSQGGLRWDLIALRCAGTVLVVPLMEELFWRSFLMRWIDRRDFLRMPPQDASAFAWWASSSVFALAHELWLAALVAGLAYGWIYRKSGSLRLAIGAHALTNLALSAWIVSQRAWQYW